MKSPQGQGLEKRDIQVLCIIIIIIIIMYLTHLKTTVADPMCCTVKSVTIKQGNNEKEK